MFSPPSSSVSQFCSSLWPSWFFPSFYFFPSLSLPPCLLAFLSPSFPPSLPACLPPFPPSVYRQASEAIQSCHSEWLWFAGKLPSLSPPWPSDLIHAGKDDNLLQRGWGLCVCTCMWDELSKSLSMGGGTLKNSHHTQSAQCMCLPACWKRTEWSERLHHLGFKGGVWIIFWACYYVVTRILCLAL